MTVLHCYHALWVWSSPVTIDHTIFNRQKQKNTNVIKRKGFEQIAIYYTLGLRLLKDGT